LTGRLIDSQVDLSNTQKNIAQSEYDRYQKTYIPIEDRIAREAQAFDTEAERERYAGLAASDIAGAYKGTAQMGLRSQGRFGLRPNANALAAIDSQLRAQQAGQTASAMTNARYAARDTGTQRLMNAVGVGKGLSTTASTAATGATAGYNNASNMQMGANQSYNAGASNALQFTNTGVGALSSAGSQYGALSNYGQRNYETQSKQMSSLINAGAMFLAADGTPGGVQDPKGTVRGPGTETSDSIPAMLSKGEYVIPADVVRRKGVEFFDKLLEKHHTPAEIQEQRLGLRRR
jgi:hypothetical protein